MKLCNVRIPGVTKWMQVLSERKLGECVARCSLVSGLAVCKGLGTLQPDTAAVVWQLGVGDSMLVTIA